MMKELLYILFCSIWILGCSKDPKQSSVSQKMEVEKKYNINQHIPEESKNISEKNYIENVFKSIKHYDKEPIYYYRINKQNCIIEIFVNDVRDYRDFELSNLITPEEVGNILKSGPQKVTVKMYPVGNLLNESWGKTDGKPMTELSENSEVSIEVISIDEKSPKGLNDEKEIIKITSPKEAAGKNYYEFSFTFNAEVPYEFEGWTKGQDLRKLDQDLVRKKALEFYQMVGEIYINKDLNSRLKLDYPSTVRIKSSFFRNKENIEATLAEYKNDLTDYNYKVSLSEKFRMEYMGNTKLLRLITENQDPTLKEGGALLLEYDNGGIFQPGITLYLPEGRDLATQGFMMWK